VKPYYERGNVRIYHGDCLDVLADERIEFDTVLGDPPYSSGGRSQAAARGNFEKSSREDWFLGDNMGVDSYAWWMRGIAGLLFEGASAGAHAYLFTDWRQYGNLVTAFETKRWTLRSVVVWDKARGGAMGSFWRSNHEWVPVFTKGPPRPIAHPSAYNTWTGVKPQDDDHPVVKPEGLVRYILEAAGGGTVLDPWMGSGTTLRVAKDMGRPAVGIEIEERWCEVAARRLSQEVLPFVDAGDEEVGGQLPLIAAAEGGP
jgi:site-specific DNA-methyltransferase (adenine-specific)